MRSLADASRRKIGKRAAVTVVMKKVRSESMRRSSKEWENVVREGCHNLVRGIPKRYTGPEGPGFLLTPNAALKGRSSTAASRSVIAHKRRKDEIDEAIRTQTGKLLSG